MKVKVRGVIVPNNDKRIYDWFGIEAVSPKDVIDQVEKANGEELEIEINSGGGDVFAGSDIYTALKSYRGNVVAKIVGVAASAASVVAMAANRILISPTAQIMIHNVSMSGVGGDYRNLERRAEMLKNYNVSIANAYQLRTDLSQEDLLDLMNKETWLNAQRAIELKFVDEIMFDEGHTLVASLVNGMLPPEVISKTRSQIRNSELDTTKARLNLLKLRGVN